MTDMCIFNAPVWKEATNDWEADGCLSNCKTAAYKEKKKKILNKTNKKIYVLETLQLALHYKSSF